MMEERLLFRYRNGHYLSNYYLKNRLSLSELIFPPFLLIVSAFWEDCCHLGGSMTPVASSPWKASLIWCPIRARTRTLRDLNVISINNFLGWPWVGSWKLHFMVILCYVLSCEKKLPDIGNNEKTFLEYLRVHTLFMHTRNYFLCFLLSDLLMEFDFLSL